MKKSLAALFLAAALLLNLTACGLLIPDEEIVGDDWRTWGLIDSYGTLQRSGTEQTVCICVTGVSVDIYRDDASQMLLDSAELPVALSEEYDDLSVSLDDLNGDGDSDLQLTVNDSAEGNLLITWLYEDSVFVFHSELSNVQTAEAYTYFEEAELYPNAEANNGAYGLESGFCCYLTDTTDYRTGKLYAEVNLLDNQIHDGCRELRFEFVCYFDKADAPNYSGANATSMNSMLFDANTGMWLTESSVYNDAEMDENHYVHTVSYGGEDIELEYFASVEWAQDNGDWYKVMTKTYQVYLPEDYTGLMLAVTPMPDNYADFATVNQLEYVSPCGLALDIPVIDLYGSLLFSIA